MQVIEILELYNKSKEQARSENKQVTTYQAGNISNIISEINEMIKTNSGQSASFAEKLRGKTREETGENVWKFIKISITYKLDPDNWQFVKTPSRILADGFGDCKSYAILTKSIMHCLGIPCKTRYVSYSPDKTITHVYSVITLENGKDYPIDVCLLEPGKEKKYTYKKDYMTQIAVLSGLPQEREFMPLPALISSPYSIDPHSIKSGELDLLLERERLELEKQIHNKQRISGTKDLNPSYDYHIGSINYALQNLHNPDHIEAFGDSITGTGEIGKLKLGKFFKKAGAKLKKGLKAITKLSTAPMRLMIKGILEKALPASAPSFLYLYIPESQVSKYPAIVQKKRAKMKKIRDFICDVIHMNGDHFDKLVRNGIMKHTHHTPEQLIAQMQKRINGIGIIPVVVAVGAKAVKILIPLVKKLIKTFKKKPKVQEDVSVNDAPSPADFGNATASATENTSSFTSNTSSGASEYGGSGGSSSGGSSMERVAPTMDNTLETTDPNAPTGGTNNASSGLMAGNNNMLLIGGAAIAAFFLLGKKK